MPRHLGSRCATAAVAALTLVGTLLAPAADAADARLAAGPTPPPAKRSVAVGSGGAVASVDRYATQVGLDVLRRGGNAVDAAVAAAATLGVTQPFSAGVGGGGFLLYYDARSGQAHTIDGRETAPARMTATSFLDPATHRPLPFDQAVNSGLSVGVPGTPATWSQALRRWGSWSLGRALAPAAAIARRGFPVDANFRAEIAMNQARFADIAPTAALYLPGGRPPAVGSVFRNPDLAGAYDLLAKAGVDAVYHGALGREISAAATRPPVVRHPRRRFRPGLMSPADLAKYTAPEQAPTSSDYHGLTVYGMAPPSSGGIAVGETLNILDRFRLSPADQVQALHDYLEASRLAYADRDRWVGDPSRSRVPTQGLLSPAYAARRACLIRPDRVLASPAAPGDPAHPGGCVQQPMSTRAPREGQSTTHLVVADRWGDVVSYTLTIEQTGGSAIVVPHRGFLLNNELTDFDFAPIRAGVPDPNLPGGGKRPRSSMAPTLVLRDGRPLLALGSPGGATIITTVTQILLDRLDLGMTLPQAVAAPRVSQQNGASAQAEPAFFGTPVEQALTRLGHRFTLAPPTFTPKPEIGAAAALEFWPRGQVQAVAEPVRRSGGAAGVVRPAR